MKWIFIGLAIFAALCIFLVLYANKINKNTKNAVRNKYQGWEMHYSDVDHSFCAIDFENSKIALFSVQKPEHKEYRFSDIAGVEIRKDGVTIASTDRGSQAVGAALGAIAFGGVGAIIGGLSGSSIQQERIRSLTLVVKVRDREYPVHNINFFTCNPNTKGEKVTSHLLVEPLANIENFATHIENAIYESQQVV